MQTAAGRRAFSALASKIHPQLPLSPRESQQLLNILTTSFRAHLDREHPVFAPEESGNGRNQITRKERSTASPGHPESSYSLATEHMDSILSNPLFARKPPRRESDSAAVDVLKDPLNWFLDQVAAGTADIPKAAMCLRVLRGVDTRQPRLKDNRQPGSLIAEWLRSSGLDASKVFLEASYSAKDNPRFFMNALVRLLLAENNQAPLWRWFTRLSEQWMQETGVDAACVHGFRMHLLNIMVPCAESFSRDEALAMFLRARQMAQAGEYGLTHKNIQNAGASLVNRIIANPSAASSPELYESFLQSTSDWLGAWSRAAQSMLWLYHPTKPTALPGLSFIKHPKGAASFVISRKSRQQFLVQLCLGVARQLLEEGKFSEAQIAMDFTREHFAEIVLSKTSSNHNLSSRERTKQEKENLEMLDRLLPT